MHGVREEMAYRYDHYDYIYMYSINKNDYTLLIKTEKEK